MKKSTLLLPAAGVAAALVLSACASGTSDKAMSGSDSGSAAQSSSMDDPLYKAAYDKAKAIADGQDLKGEVTILGVLGGEELDLYKSLYQPFIDATGVDVAFESTCDMNSILQTRIDGGNPPDVISSAQVGQLLDLMNSGDMLALSDLVSADALKNYPDSVLNIVSKDSKTYALMHASALEGLVYYNPENYDGPTDAADWAELTKWTTAKADSGSTPWCVALESGSASGWPATDWIEELFLTGAGGDAYQKWTRGELEWTSPEMKAAWEAFGAVAADPKMVNGGPTAVISTDFTKGLLPLWADPARCNLAMQADWLTNTVLSQVPGTEVGKNLDFFIAPPVKAENKGLLEISGNILGAFKDTPEVRAFLEYMASTESQDLVAHTGQWLPTNSMVSDTAFKTEDRLAQANLIKESTGAYFDASDMLPAAENEAFWAATLDYVSDPTKLDSILAHLDEVRVANH